MNDLKSLTSLQHLLLQNVLHCAQYYIALLHLPKFTGKII